MTDRKPTIGFWATATIAAASVIAALYVLSYVLLVTGERINYGERHPRYGPNIGIAMPARMERGIHWLFCPAHWIDKEFVRPLYWNLDDFCGRVEFVNDDKPDPDAASESN